MVYSKLNKNVWISEERALSFSKWSAHNEINAVTYAKMESNVSSPSMVNFLSNSPVLIALWLSPTITKFTNIWAVFSVLFSLNALYFENTKKSN